ncbi:P-loop containing nucleoside triphosphate hydrolase protein [Epithele typhae]|uniref:P-loop containing nucleoside triphosphate hydrolase protein n=1 Tax=Epithele typhae TaxID=378194 RepID=UPI00200777CE|nr:P-loop containing nucleoside triphosphate hydrolase protein [Epithele typhae]KAH9912698.1 P-loop containing nucleoside triphosphate hydrolase protein [Epithele typhae]
MPKIAALKGIGSDQARKSARRTPPHKLKRKYAWVDVDDDDDLTVKSSSSRRPSPKGGRPVVRSPHPHGPRKKPQMSAPAAFSIQTKGSVPEQRQHLPIFAGKDAIIEVIRKNDVTILIGETGSGKTTQIPQYVLEAGLAGDGMVAVTQPRRVAATSLAARVAKEQKTAVGGRVGYSVRFDEASSSDTKIKYATDGMLVRELLGDPLLLRYGAVIVDEAHERTLRTDLLIANLKTILHARRRSPTPTGKGKGKGKATDTSHTLPPLKIIIMSATLEADKFSKFFGGSKVVYVKGRQHPVTIYHTAVSQPDYVDAALRTFFQIHTDQPPGDVLVFLPGQEDITSLEKSIQMYASNLPTDALGVLVCPIYAALPPQQQAKVFTPAPSGTRKCILATNIAETSITIPGVKYVIDTGKCKEKRHVAKHTGTGDRFDTLLTRDITQSSAIQRAGRAGREGKGFCFRLYTEDSFNKMPLTAEPEIRRCTLTSALLQLKCLDQNLEELTLLDAPDMDGIASALKTLYLLSALSPAKALTPLGRQMAALPLEPPLARAVLAGAELGCGAELIALASVLSASSPLFIDAAAAREAAADARRKFRDPAGDHLTALNVVRAHAEVGAAEGKGAQREWCRRACVNERCLVEAGNIAVQLREVCARLGVDCSGSAGDEREGRVLRALVRGLVQNTAFLQPDGTYKQVMGHSVVKIHPSSVLADKKVPAIVYDELVYTTQIYARGVSAIPRSFIAEVPVLRPRSG